MSDTSADPIDRFLAERIALIPDHYLTMTDLYEEYMNWLGPVASKQVLTIMPAFSFHIQSRGIVKFKQGGRVWFQGVQLKRRLT